MAFSIHGKHSYYMTIFSLQIENESNAAQNKFLMKTLTGKQTEKIHEALLKNLSLALFHIFFIIL